MNNIKERVDELLQKPMSRQQFLKQMGLVALTVVGVTNIVNAFDSKGPFKSASMGGGAGMAYGSSVYAGGKKSV